HRPLWAPMGVYRAQDGFLDLAVGNDEMFRRFAEVLGQSGLAQDERFARGPARVRNRRALDEILRAALAARPVAAWVETLNAAGVACGPIYTLDQVFADPQVRGLGLVHEQEHPAYGQVKVLGLPVALSRTPPTVRAPAPRRSRRAPTSRSSRTTARTGRAPSTTTSRRTPLTRRFAAVPIRRSPWSTASAWAARWRSRWPATSVSRPRGRSSGSRRRSSTSSIPRTRWRSSWRSWAPPTPRISSTR